jgi:hypothetical protein
LGLVSPQAGQVMHLEISAEPSAPVLARVSDVRLLDTVR